MIQTFTVESYLHRFLKPREDFVLSSRKNILINKERAHAVVADGITRDPEGFGILPEFSFRKPGFFTPMNLLRILKFKRKYPDYAKQAAKLFCLSVSNGLESIKENEIGEKSLHMALEEGNKRLMGFNQKNFLGENHLSRDLAGCVASALLVYGRDVFYGVEGDCGIGFFNCKTGEINATENGLKKLDEHLKTLPEYNWRKPEWREYVRKLRNTNSQYAFEAFTGEPTAMDFLFKGYRELGDEEIAIAYSDGLENVVKEDGKFKDCLRKGFQTRNFSDAEKRCSEKVKTEGTLAILLPDF